MTNGNEFKLGGNNGNSVDLTKLKSGVKRTDFEADAKMLQIFDAVDSNSNQTLDLDEVTVFTESIRQAANGDETITKQEAQQVFKAQQEQAKANGEDAKKYDIKAKDLFGFVNKFLDVSAKSNIKSSVVDEQGNQTLTYEDGAQEILNKDGSKVLIQVIDGKKVSKTLNNDGKIEKEETEDVDNGIVETLIYGENGALASRIAKTGSATEEIQYAEDGQTPKFHTITTENAKYEIGTEGFAKDKIIKEVKGNGDNQQTIVYNYTSENDWTQTLSYQDTETLTTVKDGKVVTIDATQYDENHNKVQSVVIAEDGTQTTSLYKNNKVVYEVVDDPKGKKTETTFNEQGHRLAQQITNSNGSIQLAEYDGNGNTRVVVQNGETITSMGRKFHRTTSQLASANSGHVYKDSNGNPYFLVGDQVNVPGEFSADYRGLQHRNGAAVELAEYTAQEEQRVAERLRGKEQKTVAVTKDYPNWYKFAEEQLKSEGNQKPTNQQINDRTNELLLLNPNVEVPKKGTKIVAIKTEDDIKADNLRAQQQHSQDVRRGVVNDMVHDYNKAKESFDLQMKKDGWAADVADAVSYIWNNDWWSATGNTARQVRQDLAEYKDKLESLRAAYREGEPQFKAKFRETFGVEYNQQNVEAYNASRKKLEQVSTTVATEKAVTARMDALFANYDKEKAIVDRSVKQHSALVDERGMHGAQFAIQQELQQLLGLSNADMVKLSQDLQAKGKSLDINYMKQVYGEIKTGLAKQRKDALAGKTIEQYQSEMNMAYKKAYGERTDIVKRVADYNSSQDTGAMVVKTTSKIVGSAVIAVATGGTASGLLVGAVGSSAFSFAVDATDMMTDGIDHSIDEYGKSAVCAAIDGTAQVLSGGMSRALKAAEVGRIARYSTQALTDVGLDLTSDYIRTGEIHLSTAITSAVSSVGGEMLGDFIEGLAKRKAVEREFSQMEIRTTDPIDDVPSNWATMTPEERSANLRQRQIDHENWLNATSNKPALDAAAVERINPEHSRYAVIVNPDEMGGVQTQDLGNGIRGIVDDPGHIRTDVTSTQMRAAISDVSNLGINTRSEFGQGLVKLENIQQARTSYSSSASGAPKFNGATGDNVTPYGTFRRNQQVKAMGLQDDISLVQDAATISGKAYNLSDPKKDIDGWKFLSSETSENGFAARAYEKDGKIVIAFRGSDDTADLTADFRILTGRTPEQLRSADAFVTQIKEQYPDAKIIVTGHSLGGSLTEMVASQHADVLGITFDAIGTRGVVESAGGALKDNHNTVNYIINGDVLSNADAHVGQVVLTDAVVQGGKLNSPHAIGNFMGIGNNSLAGVEQGIVARTVDANAGQTRLSDLLGQSTGGKIEIDDRNFKRISAQFEYDVNTLGADLDALESQISSVANVSQRAQLQSIVDSRRIAITQGTDITGNSHTLRSMTGDEINDVLARDYGFTEPGFLGGSTPSAEIIIDKPTKLVRVFNDENAFAKGSWLMPYDQIVGKSPEEIKDFFALPNMPKYIVEIEVPAGTRMFTGLCNPLEGWGNGGGTQFFIVGDVRPKQYGQMRLINGATN